jgi:ADP-ribose pyrophosphatase YjhB (NUDIX family)
MEPKWLLWARELQAMAQTGLAFTKDAYDGQRYERLRQLAAQMMAEHAGVEASRVEGLFSQQVGYATPKVDVRGAVFKEGRVLLVRERADAGRWTLPGGWADVNRSPRESVVAEVREEAGLEVKPIKLAAVYDRSRHPYVPPYAFHIYKMFFICEIASGACGCLRSLTPPLRATLRIPHLQDVLHLRDRERGTVSWHGDRLHRLLRSR